MLCANATFAQKQMLDREIEISTSGKTLKEIIIEIEQKSGLSFSYSDNLLPKTHFNEIDKRQTIGTLLNSILHQNDIDYKIIDNQIVLFKSVSQEEEYHCSGFLLDERNSESIINGAIYVADVGNGTLSNNYGYFSLLLTEGPHHLKFYSLGYEAQDTVIDIKDDIVLTIRLTPVSYQMNEIVVADTSDKDFMESAMSTIAKLNIKQLKELPNVLGEHDALRNLDLMAGLQMSEFSTSNICVRGGTGNQTTFLMDEANIYNASHFGGFSSVFNPDVVNHINIYKNELPASESGSLSSVIDVRLRDGDMQQWHASGTLGLLTARALVEGPLKKDKSSILLAVRRTYADKVFEPFWENRNFSLKFYFYDINFKFNYKFNERNRLYWSWYSGADKLDHSMYLKSMSYITTLRLNHIFGEHLFCNLSVIGSQNRTNLSNFYYNGAFKWHSICWDTKAKLDFTHHVNEHISLNYGWQTSFYSLEPFDLSSDEEETTFRNTRIHAQPILNQGIYIDQTYKIGAMLSFNIGVRGNMFKGPTNYKNESDSTIYYPEWNFTVNCKPSDKLLIKLNTSSKTQPIHQLQVSSYGITINRWMPSNDRYMPERSHNASISFNYKATEWLNATANLYVRRMENLIETMQEMRLIYEIDPEKYVHHSSAKVEGCELTANLTVNKLRITTSYDYTNSMWLTQGLNDGKRYPASFIRKHSFNIIGTYHASKRVKLSMAWQIASGIPYTTAVGKYVIDGKTVLQFDDRKINTTKLPNYNRLDASVDIEGKNNDIKRWKSYWNFAIYNIYARKNPLGVAYFMTDENGNTTFKPGYYYFYQFVPSVSYRFVF